MRASEAIGALAVGEEAGGIPQAGVMPVQNENNAGLCSHVYDGNGNVMWDAPGWEGALVAQYEYGPFGELVRATGLLACEFNFLFSTKYFDWETGLHYYGYRYYNPTTGRWLSRDPIGERGGLNVYGFVRNQPTSLFDALGLEDGKANAVCCTCDPGKVFAAIILGERVNVGNKTGNVYNVIDESGDFVEKLEKAFPGNKEIKKICKELGDVIGKVGKAANLTEKAVIGILQIYSSPGYGFHIKLKAKYVCCAKNKLPELKVREQWKWLEDGQEDPATYYVNTMNGLTGNLAKDWKDGIQTITAEMAEDCKKAAK